MSKRFSINRDTQHSKSPIMKLGDKGLYTIIQQLKYKWDNTPITKATLLAMLKDARNHKMTKAVVFARKKPDAYKQALLVYKNRPILVRNANAPRPCQIQKLHTMYLLLPEEKAPPQVEVSPASDCEYGEVVVPLEDMKEVGELIDEIIKKLEGRKQIELPVPLAPPGDDYMYFADFKKDFEKPTLINPVTFIPKQPFVRAYDNNNWHGTVGGSQVITPISPHDDCYYMAICCNNKPNAGAKQGIKNFNKRRKFDTYNALNYGYWMPIIWYTNIKRKSNQQFPPKIRLPVYPTPPGPPSYPTPPLRRRGYDVFKPNKNPNPGTKKPVTTGRRGGTTTLGGNRATSGQKSFRNNTSYQRGANTVNVRKYTRSGSRGKFVTNTRNKPSTQRYNAQRWENNQGILTKGSFLQVRQSKPKPRENNSGLFGTRDLPNINLDFGINETGLGTSFEQIDLFKDRGGALLKAYGYYFTDPAIVVPDRDFGTVATNNYLDNFFFYPMDIASRLPRHTFADFFVKMKGEAIHTDGTVNDMRFVLLAHVPGTPVYKDIIGTGKQSVGIEDSPNIVAFDLRITFEKIPGNGEIIATLRGHTGDNVPLGAPVVAVRNTTSLLNPDNYIHVVMELTQNVNSAGILQSVSIDTKLKFDKSILSLPTYNSGAIPVPARLINKLAFGAVEYENPGLTFPTLTGRVPPVSIGGILTGLVFTKRELKRNYIWDYTL